MGKYKTLGKNTIFIFIGSVGSKLITFFMLPFYTRWLTVSDYGSVDLITTYSLLILGIASLSIFDALFVFPKDQSKEKQTQYFSTSIVFFSGVVLLTFAITIVIHLSQCRNIVGDFIVQNIWFIWGVIIASFFQQLVQQFIRAINKIRVYSFTGMIQTGTLCIISFILVPKFKIEGYVFAIIAANLIATLFSFFLSKAFSYISFQTFEWEILKEMLKYTVPLIPNGIMWYLISAFNRPVLENYCGLFAVGLFAVASKFPTLLNTVYQIFQQAWLISVLEEAMKGSYKIFYNRMLKLVVSGQCLLAVLISLLSPSLLKIFTTPDYYSAWQFIPILVIGVIFMNIAAFVGSNFAINKESKYYFYSTVWAGISSVILNIILIPIIGLWGASITVVVSQALCMFSRIYYSRKTVKIKNIFFYIHNILFIVSGTLISLFFNSGFPFIIGLIVLVSYYVLINRNNISIGYSYIISKLHTFKR